MLVFPKFSKFVVELGKSENDASNIKLILNNPFSKGHEHFSCNIFINGDWHGIINLKEYRLLLSIHQTFWIKEIMFHI